MMRIKILVFLAALAVTMPMSGKIGLLDNVGFRARLGYSLGGSAPVGLPATIRSLEDFPLTPNLHFGIDAHRHLTGSWGLLTGLHYENKGMSTDAKVKNYHMEIVRGGEVLNGVFTGNVVTKATEWMFTVPFMTTYDVRRFRFKFGPYFSVLSKNEFYGWAYNGYLRVGDPTGAKVVLGATPDERGDYDFSGNMRRMQFGIDLGVDYMISNRVGAYTDLSWGLTGVHKSNFHTIEQTLYPIYGTLGIIYKIK